MMQYLIETMYGASVLIAFLIRICSGNDMLAWFRTPSSNSHKLDDFTDMCVSFLCTMKHWSISS